MSEKSDTPKTDVYWASVKSHRESRKLMVDFARQLERECEALRVKAARYDWLRNSGKYAPSFLSGGGWAMTSGNWPEARTEEHKQKLDDAIDRAMAEGEKK